MALPAAAAAAAIGAKALKGLKALRAARRARRLLRAARGKKSSKRRRWLFYSIVAVPVGFAAATAAFAGSFIALILIPFLTAPQPDYGGATFSPVANADPHVFALYRQAAAAQCPGGEVDWAVLAGVGAVESAHGTLGGRSVNSDYSISPAPIFGPLLDGSLAGTRTIPIGAYAGRYGLPADAQHQRALGPMQFLPGTWEGTVAAHSLPGRDPHNYAHAAHAAAAKLCSAARRHAASGQHPGEALWSALLEYNRSDAYVASVLTHAGLYRFDGSPPPPPPARDADLLQASVLLSDPSDAPLLSSALMPPPALELLLAVADPSDPVTVEVLSTRELRVTALGLRPIHPDNSAARDLVDALLLVDSEHYIGAYVCAPVQPDPPMVLSHMPADHPSDAGRACVDEVRVVFAAPLFAPAPSGADDR